MMLSSVIGNEEEVARFVLSSRWIRKVDLTIKPDAFMPHPYTELSVTRHRGISTNQIWKHGKVVATQTNKTLYGRVDVRVSNVRKHDIDVVARPIPGENPNHACLVDWPKDKSEQKSKAQEIVAKAHYLALEE